MSSMSRFDSASDRWLGRINAVILIFLAVIVLYPIWYCVIASVSDPMAVLNAKVWIWPEGFNLKGYQKVFEHERLWIGYKNSLVYTAIGVSINLMMTILAAYPLARTELKGRGMMMAIFVFTMFFSGGLIPTYLVVKTLHLDNSMWALILPGAINTYNLIVMRTFFQNSIPSELYDAALVDGCSNTRMLLRIVLPLSKPIIAIMFLFYSVEHWNSYFNAMIYLSDRNLQTLPIVLREILIQYSNQSMSITDDGATEQMLQSESIRYASIILASLPMLLIYPLVQKYFVKGVMVGAIKG